ncbi:MAG: DUF6471 domain-containing protein [Alphaproteobacteria bacterium]|nr:DUF6471 domain-containing protein [Alphaproteobacteria bacterium]
MPIPTKARPKAAAKAPAGPPKAKAWKHSETNLAYEDRAKDLLRFAIKQNGSGYAELSVALAKLGVEITSAALENKISRGGFSAAFLMQCMDALNSNLVSLPR